MVTAMGGQEVTVTATVMEVTQKTLIITRVKRATP